MKQDHIQLKKEISQYFRSRSIKDCFYANSECSGKIINAHSIQNNGCLSLLVERVNSNDGLYIFSKYFFEENGSLQLELVGRNVASTFSGFCSFHDQTLFKSIDNNDFDYSSQQMFLYSYRAFAQTYHKKKEEFKGQHCDSVLRQKTEKDFWEDTTLGCNTAIRDIEKHRHTMNELFENHYYNQLDYFVYHKKGLYPIASSGCVNLAFSPGGKENCSFFNLEQECFPLMITVLPEVANTYVIIACFKNDAFHKALINELKFLFWDQVWIEKVISSILVFDMENTCLSPYIWRKMDVLEQQQLCDEICQSIIPTINPYYFESFNFSEINFFDPKFYKSI